MENNEVYFDFSCKDSSFTQLTSTFLKRIHNSFTHTDLVRKQYNIEFFS